jgi:hypothetical protein
MTLPIFCVAGWRIWSLDQNWLTGFTDHSAISAKMLSEPIQVTLKVISAFKHLGIPYLIGGSLASAVHGIIRATMDADLVAEIKPEQVSSLVDLLEDEFYIDACMILDAIQNAGSFNLIHLGTMFKVDVFILKQRAFDINQMQRRISQLIGDSPDDQAYFSTAEDIILAKLEWFRAGGETSERQWRDVLGILEVQSELLDYEYLRQWAVNLGIQDLLNKAIEVDQGKA